MGNGKNENYLLISVIGIGIIAILGLLVQLTGGFRTALVSNSTNQGIIVNGEGLIAVKPDISRVSLGVEAEAATAGEAQRKNSEQMSKIIVGLKNLGLAAKDIQTTEFSLFPDRRFIKELNQEKVVGYRAVNQVTVTVRDMAKLGKAIDQSIKSGANNIQNVSFEVESPEKWRGKAIEKAIKDARSKAEAMAKASGVKIKKIITMNESTIEVRPYQMDSFKRAELQDAIGAVTPIESGNVKVTANVQVIFGV
jgi:uncharacterized protein